MLGLPEPRVSLMLKSAIRAWPLVMDREPVEVLYEVSALGTSACSRHPVLPLSTASKAGTWCCYPIMTRRTRTWWR